MDLKKAGNSLSSSGCQRVWCWSTSRSRLERMHPLTDTRLRALIVSQLLSSIDRIFPCHADYCELFGINNVGKRHIPIQAFREWVSFAMQSVPSILSVHFHGSRRAVPPKETDHLRKNRSEVAQAVWTWKDAYRLYFTSRIAEADSSSSSVRSECKSAPRCTSAITWHGVHCHHMA
jgi:hypothetical protein